MLIKEALNSISDVARFAYSDALEARSVIEAHAKAKGWSMAEIGGKKLAYLKEVIATDGSVDCADAFKLQDLVKSWAEAEVDAINAASVAVLANEWDGAKEWAEAKTWAAVQAWTKVKFKIEDICGVTTW